MFSQAEIKRKIYKTIQVNNIHEFTSLLNHIDINEIIHDNQSILYCAVKLGRMDIVKILIDLGVDIDAVDYTNGIGFTSLSLAMIHEHKEIFDLLVSISKLNQSSHDFKSLFYLSLKLGRVYYTDELVKVMTLTKEVYTNEIKIAEFVFAMIENNNAKISQMIFDFTTNTINNLVWNDESIIAIAAKNNNVAVLSLLWAYGADMHINNSVNGNTILHVAAMHNALDVMQYLNINKIIDDAWINKKSNDLQSPLSLAVMHGHLDAVKQLVKYGANVNQLCGLMSEPIITLSAKVKHYAITHYLLSIVKLCEYRTSPLHDVLHDAAYDIAESLVLTNTKLLKTKNSLGNTPLQAIKPRIMNETNENIRSLMLAFAILAEDLNIVKLLIQRNVDVYLPIFDGKSPYQLAKESSSSEIKMALKHVKQARNIGIILGKPNLQSTSLLFFAAKEASKHLIAGVENGEAYFHNIPKHLEIKFTEDYQKVLIAAYDNNKTKLIYSEEKTDKPNNTGNKSCH